MRLRERDTAQYPAVPRTAADRSLRRFTALAQPMKRRRVAVLQQGCGPLRTSHRPRAEDAVPQGRRANRLVRETSPYLLQHAHNPVDWFTWGEDALERAAALDRPIFLSIGYAACHWCHVMERESFEDEATAAYLNEHFVAVKVDREERPDLDQLYMGAVQAMTGQGGWPMSVFLAADGRPFYGGT